MLHNRKKIQIIFKRIKIKNIQENQVDGQINNKS